MRLELDVFWAAVGGDAPDAVLKQWKGRVRSVHLKDVARDAPKSVSAETDIPPTAFRELGQGTLNWPRIIRAARAAGVEHYFVEMDFTPGEPLDSVRQCVQYLCGVNLCAV
ncbi:MAG: sugar phosphate isomerase/epimerase [Acidobacteria bacterium]|nr:sugar phosphate isomerase/epimerase [Acidobacteriota bacterium]